jgi:hypothetical protein
LGSNQYPPQKKSPILKTTEGIRGVIERCIQRHSTKLGDFKGMTASQIIQDGLVVAFMNQIKGYAIIESELDGAERVREHAGPIHA